MWWKQNKWKVIVPAIIVVVLAGAFWFGGNAPGLQGWTINNPDTEAANSVPPSQLVQSTKPEESTQPALSVSPTVQSSQEPDPTADPEETPEVNEEPSSEPTAEPSPDATSGATPNHESSLDYSEANGMEIDPETGKDKYGTDPVPEGKPLPVEPQDVTFSDVTQTCTLSVRCDSILQHMDWLNPDKVECVPEDGIIFPTATVTFYEGESVFNVLQREMRKAKIHMEFTNTPAYNSAYIEGINNLYEFDCGDGSGWLYCVNGWYPNYGCSRYQLQANDTIEFVYTCTMGREERAPSATGG